MYNKQKKIKIIQFYFHNNQSLRVTAKKFHIHYQTLFKWVKLYKEKGKEEFLSTYKRAGKRAKKKLEKKIVLMVEKNPTLTVRKIKEMLENEGINISIKGVWGILKRFGYAGFKKKFISSEFTKYIPWTKEGVEKFERAKEMLSQREVKKAACILNSIPSLPNNEILSGVPDKYLSLKRKIEKVSLLFEKIPLNSYLETTRELYKKCKKRELNYSALRVGLMEASALAWSGNIKKLLKKLEELEKIIKKRECCYSSSLFIPRIELFYLEVFTYTFLLEIKKAKKKMAICLRMLKGKKYLSFHDMMEIGGFYKTVENYGKAEHWFLKAHKSANMAMRKILNLELANILLGKGKYKKAISISKFAESGEKIYRPWLLHFRSILSLINGRPQKCIKLSTESLTILKKEEFKHNIFYTVLTIASGWCSLGEREKADRILKKGLQILKKYELKRCSTILEIILSDKRKSDFFTLTNEEILPTIKLALLMKNSKYWKAFSYAKKKYLIPYLYRYIFFFPETVNNLIKEGKDTGLTKKILRLPVFNKKIPVYYIKFLGELVVYKNQKCLMTKLRPKDTAFLVNFALKANEPEKKISLNKIYRNFWKNSKNPSRNLSHLLVRIKKAINLPSHLLEVSYRKDYPYLINKGIYFTTDYGEFKQTLAQAKALLRGGEWGFAKREFLRAFKLFRGEPFKKMYDNWSDDRRLEVLFSYETEVLAFVKELKKRGRKEEAGKLLKKAEKIVLYSGEIEQSMKK